MEDQKLLEMMVQITSSLSLVQSQLDDLKKAPALNGKFDQLVGQVEELHEGFQRVEDILINPQTGEGVVSRVKDIESYMDRREEFMNNSVYPAMEEFSKIKSQMELQVNPILNEYGKLREEVAELKLKQAIQAKIGWALALATGSILVKSVMDLVLTSSGS